MALIWSIQRDLGLPFLRFPSIIPCMISLCSLHVLKYGQSNWGSVYEWTVEVVSSLLSPSEYWHLSSSGSIGCEAFVSNTTSQRLQFCCGQQNLVSNSRMHMWQLGKPDTKREIHFNLTMFLASNVFFSSSSFGYQVTSTCILYSETMLFIAFNETCFLHNTELQCSLSMIHKHSQWCFLAQDQLQEVW